MAGAPRRRRWLTDGVFVRTRVAFAGFVDYSQWQMKPPQNLPRHAPSGELWAFSMDRLRELRGPDTRERDLANVLGFEHSRAVRWKEGEMYVDRAEYLVRLSEVLEVDTLLLVQVAAGVIGAEQAKRQAHRAASRSGADDAKKRKGGAPGAAGLVGSQAPIDVVADARQFAIDPARLQSSTRGVVLLVAENGDGRVELAKTMERHAELGGLAATGLAMGLTLAERYRPELVFLDLGTANVHAFDAIRVLSSLQARSGRRCRVVAGTAALVESIEKSAVMAGAGSVVLVPFPASLFSAEIVRLEERLGSRRAARK
jgi:CheY-like chemotaxis protein